MVNGRSQNSPSTFNVEDTSVRPDVLVVTDQGATGISREGSLSSTGETEEERDISVRSLVGRRVKRKVAEFDRLKVVLRGWYNV